MLNVGGISSESIVNVDQILANTNYVAISAIVDNTAKNSAGKCLAVFCFTISSLTVIMIRMRLFLSRALCSSSIWLLLLNLSGLLLLLLLWLRMVLMLSIPRLLLKNVEVKRYV